MDKWIVMMDTVVDGWVPATWVSTEGMMDVPEVHDTERDAQKEIADEIIEKLRQFIDDERDCMELCEDQCAVPCTVHPDGVIVGEDGEVIWSPHVDQSTYGR